MNSQPRPSGSLESAVSTVCAQPDGDGGGAAIPAPAGTARGSCPCKAGVTRCAVAVQRLRDSSPTGLGPDLWSGSREPRQEALKESLVQQRVLAIYCLKGPGAEILSPSSRGPEAQMRGGGRLSVHAAGGFC